MIKKTKILKSDLEVYPIGQGTLFGRSFDGQSNKELIAKKIDVLNYGIELGMNFIDTGEDYEGGISEELLSEVLKSKRARSYSWLKIQTCKQFIQKCYELR